MGSGLRVRDLMTEAVQTLGHNDRLSLADDLMRMQRVRHVPVLDEEGHLVGIVSQRDLFRGALARALGYGETAQQKLLDLLVVKEVMTRPVKTIGPDASLAQAAALMRDEKIGCLVVADGEALVGILSEGDFLSWIAENG